MKSYQNAALLQNLYRLKSLGFEYCEPIIVNRPQVGGELPDDLQQLRRIIAECHLCDLNKVRKHCMTGHGALSAKVMFIDAFVSMAEDEGGTYFAGRSGTSLQNMITNVLSLSPESVYFTHTVKCKAPGSNRPSSSECNSCAPYWRKEIALLRPEVIVTLGPDAYRIVTEDETPFEQVRGHKIDFLSGTVLYPIHHPNFLLRNPSLKKETFFDLQNIKAML